EFYRDLIHRLHDVGGRHHEAVVRDERPRADLAEPDLASGGDLTALRPDDDHGRIDLPEYFSHRLTVRRRDEPEQRDRHQERDCLSHGRLLLEFLRTRHRNTVCAACVRTNESRGRRQWSNGRSETTSGRNLLRRGVVPCRDGKGGYARAWRGLAFV